MLSTTAALKEARRLNDHLKQLNTAFDEGYPIQQELSDDLAYHFGPTTVWGPVGGNLVWCVQHLDDSNRVLTDILNFLKASTRSINLLSLACSCYLLARAVRCFAAVCHARR